MKRASIWILTATLLAVASPAAAGDVGDWLDSADWRQWGAQDFGNESDEFKTVPTPSTDGSSDTGRRVAAGGMSLLIPGTGQFYNGDVTKGIVMLGVDVVIWSAYLGFDNHADNLMQESQEWSGIYAGTSGEHSDNYWQDVGRYMDGDEWYESQLREARAFGEPAPAPPADSDLWQWRNEGYKDDYQEIRASANTAYDNRDLMILFALINRAVSVFDAVKNGGAPSDDGSAMGANILGADVAVEVSPSWKRPAARAVASWSF